MDGREIERGRHSDRAKLVGERGYNFEFQPLLTIVCQSQLLKANPIMFLECSHLTKMEHGGEGGGGKGGLSSRIQKRNPCLSALPDGQLPPSDQRGQNDDNSALYGVDSNCNMYKGLHRPYIVTEVTI